MEPAAIESVPLSREHAWGPKPGEPHPYWEERLCGVCGLEDMRVRDRSPGPRRDWSVTTPCIEPVPESVSYDDLARELKQHKVKPRPLVIGVPGQWQAGFSVGGDGYHLYPRFEVTTLGRGFALLLKWIRARQYDVNRYSDFDYVDGLNRRQYNVIDDD